MDTELSKYISECKETVETALSKYFDSPHVSQSLRKAMEYSVFSQCKRFRPALCLAACEAVGGERQRALPFTCAVELVHTYSLIHDDLPAMDDDDLRRGKPSNHIQFGEAKAILAGDALLTMAFDIASHPVIGLESSTQIKMISLLASSSGHKGMVAGQVLDIEAENKVLSFEDLENIHLHKTGKLIQCAISGGAMAGGADCETLVGLEKYGRHLGLAFQISDDILDFTGKIPGKKQGGDVKKNKATFATLLGPIRSKKLLIESVDSAIGCLNMPGQNGRTLRKLALFIRDRV